MPEMPETPMGSEPLAETAKIRAELDVADVVVLPTGQCADPRTKRSAKQRVIQVDWRHHPASKLGAAGVAYLSLCDSHQRRRTEITWSKGAASAPELRNTRKLGKGSELSCG